MPFGCTNYTHSEQATILHGVRLGILNPIELENLTHANARGGYGIRESLLACTQPSDVHPERLGWIGGFYNIRASGILDFFDAFRLAQVSGLPEQRTISWGVPWFASWEATIRGQIMRREQNGTYTLISGQEKHVVMPMPLEAELQAVRRDPGAFGWHDSLLDGWTQKNGPLTYRDKSWQGAEIGDGGYIYFPREVINVVMAIPGTVAYTATLLKPETIQTVDVTAVQWIVSLIRNLLGLK
jgi:hypothetical protein